MKRWLLFIFFLTIVIVAVVAIRHAKLTRERREREARYQALLCNYSGTFAAGMTRKEVEDSLQAEKVSFYRIYGIDEKGAYADITKIGQESAPWYCSELNIYVAFQFVAAAQRLDSVSQSPEDPLKEVTIFRHLENCL